MLKLNLIKISVISIVGLMLLHFLIQFEFCKINQETFNFNRCRGFFHMQNDYGSKLKCSEYPMKLIGPITVDESEISLDVASRMDFGTIGGHYVPEMCSVDRRVAILIPYRQREEHLAKFLKHMHPFLMKQHIEYRIYVIEQYGDSPFNRGKLFNVGFVEASKQHDWGCFIFHDVDLLPIDDRISYACRSAPVHMSAAIDKFNYKLLYKRIFGGICSMSADHFKTINGFSNQFWGWGGEDDDFCNRVFIHDIELERYSLNVARYIMLRHISAKPNPGRGALIKKNLRTLSMIEDGLNSLNYNLIETTLYKTYTHFLVDIDD